MRWHVKGVNRTTGEDAEMYVDSPSKHEAIRQAGVTMLIEAVESVHTPPPPLDYHVPTPPMIPAASQAEPVVLFRRERYALYKSALVVGATSYPVRNITSVTKNIVHHVNPKQASQNSMVGFGVLFGFLSAMGLFVSIGNFEEWGLKATLFFTLAVIGCAAMVVHGLKFVAPIPPTYELVITTAAGEFVTVPLSQAREAVDLQNLILERIDQVGIERATP